jgi:methionine-rich copper-binding protein CopC
MTRFSLLAALAGATLMAASPALAHTELVRSNPAANATLRNGPRSITLTFNERLVPRFSKFELHMPKHGNMAVPVRTSVSADGKRIVGTLANRLGKGDYTVTWTAAGSDGHRMTGTVAFKVV